MGERSRLPALWRNRSIDPHERQDDAPRPVSMQRLPRAVHRHRRNALRALKVPLHIWLAVTHLMMASKKGMSALQISRMIGMPYKTVWFLCHRIRESLKTTPDIAPMGGAQKVIEADETYVGGKAKNRAHRQPAPKQAVFSLVERDGNVRSFPYGAGIVQNASPDHRREREQGVNAHDGRKHAIPETWRGLFVSRDCQSFCQRIRPRLFLAYEHGRRIFQSLEARCFRDVPSR